VDEIYDKSIVALNARWAKFCDLLDAVVWGGVVQLISLIVIAFSWLNSFVDEHVVNRGFDTGCGRVSFGGRVMSRLQDGRVQNYLRVIGLALAVFALMLIWGCNGP
jgi:NADH-quinone oxidoreductase subunit L